MSATVTNKVLQHYCLTDTMDLFYEFQLQQTDPKTDNPYVYIDRGSNVLAVVHLDTVQDYGRNHRYLGKDGKTYVQRFDETRYSEMQLTSRKKIKRAGCVSLFSSTRAVKSIALDDRLGLYVIMELLPKYGIMPDVLMTVDEEIGMSTARDFFPEKQYNWMFSFDRRGLQPVLYEYDTPELRQVLSAFGYSVTYGSFSDISDLEHLGCSGINFAVGYDYEHTHHCIASLETVNALVEKFVRFYDTMKDVVMPYVYQPKKYADWGDEWGRSTWDYGYNDPNDDETVSGIAEAVHNSEYLDMDTFTKLGNPACDFCGMDGASHIVPLDGDYYLCTSCYNGVRIAGHVPDDWDDSSSTRTMR